MMGHLFIMIVSTVISTVGYYIGGIFGTGPAFVLSSVAGVVGYYYGWKWNRDLFC